MERFLLLSHILCGGIVLLLGLIQMINRKGGKSHLILGKMYVASMWWICLSALSIISFYRFSAFLMVIAALTFHSSFVGVRVLRRKHVSSEKWYDWLVGIATCVFGIVLIIYGGHVLLNDPSQKVLAFLCALFGLFTAKNGADDILFFIRKKLNDRSQRLQNHISAMGGSYIAAVTAFAVQNPNLFMPENVPQWLLWILPGAVGSFIIGAARKKWKKKVYSSDATL